ncbi:MAG: IS1634 family transposase, partial [Verrucomicrobiia bacterium]
MYLRRHRRRAAGESYEYWTLCESVRTGRGPRQRIVASLGKLDVQEAEAGWEQIEELLEGRPVSRQMEFGQSMSKEGSGVRWEMVDVSSVRVERAREFGEVYLALALWRRLQLHELLEGLIESGRESVEWEKLISILVAARFCAQRSELSIAEGWYERTALEDLLGVEVGRVNDDRLYRGLDVLGAHKERLCAHLMDRYRGWFGVRFEFLIYDVTSTFFEGQALSNAKAARGYSRDGRPDCKQVCIGLVCTPEGLPLSYEIFGGNRADVTTVEEIVSMMEQKYGQAERVWVMDRGMVSEANIAFLRSRKARYLVGTPKSQLRHFEAQMLQKEGWVDVQEGLEVRLVEHPDGLGEEQYVLCRSTARAQKERAMLQRQSEALTEKLVSLDRALRRKPQQDHEAVGRRIGRAMGAHPAAARIIEARVLDDDHGCACALQIFSRWETGSRTVRSHGAYLLRTNCTERDPTQLWRWYIQLTQAEAAFRTAKSDLGLRPVFHQKTGRVEAHILVCFLALALWRTLEMWMA